MGVGVGQEMDLILCVEIIQLHMRSKDMSLCTGAPFGQKVCYEKDSIFEV